METLSSHEITELLEAWNRGDEQALQKLTPIIYEELYRSAKRLISRGRRDNSMQTTALINELYVRMLDAKRVSWQNRAHFFALCARQMRSILVDFFRARQYQKRGGGAARISFDESLAVSRETGRDLVAVDEALNRLTSLDARKGQVIELRFFGGLSVKETAEDLSRNGDAGLEIREGMVARRVEPLKTLCRRSAGGKSTRSSTRR